MPTLYTARSGLNHDTGPGHPERAARLQTLLDLFTEAPFKSWPQIDARAATRAEILRAHPERYIAMIGEASPDFGQVPLDGDTIMSPGTLEAAYQAAGAVCQAVDDIADGKTARAFCAVRPPGHHAEPVRPMGFCIFNNIFIGARQAQERGLNKIAIVDFDVHHGNATDTMARAARDIFFASSHQFPFWPGTGDPKDNIEGKILNVPLTAGSEGAEFRRLYEMQIFPALEAFKPDLLMISAGFDAHRDDPLAEINLVKDDFAWVTAELCKIADRHAQGRVVSVLEGGYNLDSLKSSVSAHLKAMAEA